MPKRWVILTLFVYYMFRALLGTKRNYKVVEEKLLGFVLELESRRKAHRTGPKFLYNSPSTTARRQLRIKTNWFINSVAVADLSVGGVIPNMFVYDVKLGSSGDI